MTQRALVVDDDQSMVKTLTDVLRLKGWEVQSAYSGAEAVELTRSSHFDVVLMDIRMPGMDGVDALKEIRSAHADTCVVLMTAYAAPDRIEEAERAGVKRVLSKPVDLRKLLALLSECVADQRPVLLIDHDAAFLKTLSEVLTLKGFHVVMADDVEHAISLMSAQRPMAVLLHIHVGGPDVRETIATVHRASPAVALILYSGRPGAEAEAERALPGRAVRAYLQKPFAIDEVTGVLDAIRYGL